MKAKFEEVAAEEIEEVVVPAIEGIEKTAPKKADSEPKVASVCSPRGVNVRVFPELSAPIIGSLQNGVPFIVLEEQRDFVRCERGWVMKSLIKFEPDTV